MNSLALETIWRMSWPLRVSSSCDIALTSRPDSTPAPGRALSSHAPGACAGGRRSRARPRPGSRTPRGRRAGRARRPVSGLSPKSRAIVSRWATSGSSATPLRLEAADPAHRGGRTSGPRAAARRRPAADYHVAEDRGLGERDRDLAGDEVERLVPRREPEAAEPARLLVLHDEQDRALEELAGHLHDQHGDLVRVAAPGQLVRLRRRNS